MDFDETFDRTFFHATFEMDLNDFDENKENMETPVFDFDTDDLLLELDERIGNGENVDLPQLDIADNLSEKKRISTSTKPLKTKSPPVH